MFLQCLDGYELTPSEKNAIDYVNVNIESVVDMTIAEIAEQAFVSKATLFRALHKCGIEKITDIRYRVAKDKYIVNETLNKVFEEYAKTIEQLDEMTMQKVAQYIRSAKQVSILSNGAARYMAEEMGFYLKFQSVDARLLDLEIVKNHSDVLKKSDLILIFTIEDENAEIVNCVSKTKTDEVVVITCCCKKDSSLEKISNIVLYGKSHSMLTGKSVDLGSTLGLRAIMRAIVEYLS